MLMIICITFHAVTILQVNTSNMNKLFLFCCFFISSICSKKHPGICFKRKSYISVLSLRWYNHIFSVSLGLNTIMGKLSTILWTLHINVQQGTLMIWVNLMVLQGKNTLQKFWRQNIKCFWLKITTIKANT